MSQPKSIHDIDFSPKAGYTYWKCDREWREDFIYFLMVDRFHDGKSRTSASGFGRSQGFGTKDELKKFCGGNLRGIIKNLDYLEGLGVSALWLSPIFENDDSPDPNSHSYHGYAIRNYLNIDPRFGTKDDLVELVNLAHKRNMRVYLDAVANHSGDVWYYPDDKPYYYSDDERQYPIGGFRSPDYPVPVELRNPDYYQRRGQIRPWGWDKIPETLWGDFFTLKGFNNEEDPSGLELQEVIIAAHKYWIREADIDGYRMDAVKHMGERAIARFCDAMREYAYSLGKSEFFLFGELVAGDDVINRYTGASISEAGNSLYYGLNSVLDFPLYWTLPGTIKGLQNPRTLISRYDAIQKRAVSHGKLGRYMVTFLDNHDQIGQDYKRRFAAGAFDEQVIAGIGYLICAIGTPCIYYGTEQGFNGEGNSDEFIREAMFDLSDKRTDVLNRNSKIYKRISELANLYKQEPVMRFGRIYFRPVSYDGVHFDLPYEHPCLFAFSRVLAEREILIVYNTSTNKSLSGSILVDAKINPDKTKMSALFSGVDENEKQKSNELFTVTHKNGIASVSLQLAPMQFMILTAVKK